MYIHIYIYRLRTSSYIPLCHCILLGIMDNSFMIGLSNSCSFFTRQWKALISDHQGRKWFLSPIDLLSGDLCQKWVEFICNLTEVGKGRGTFCLLSGSWEFQARLCCGVLQMQTCLSPSPESLELSEVCPVQPGIVRIQFTCSACCQWFWQCVCVTDLDLSVYLVSLVSIHLRS